MSKIDENCKYTETDEWVRADGNKVKIGISDYAQDKLNDLTYVDLPPVGDKLAQGDALLVVESVKSAADISSPVSGTIIAINEELEDNAEMVNEDPYGEGWLVEMEIDDPSELESLLTPDAYKSKIGE